MTAEASEQQHSGDDASERSAREIADVEQRLEELAGRSSFAEIAQSEQLNGSDVMRLLGGARGVVETMVPSVLFISAFALARAAGVAAQPTLALALGLSLGVSALFVTVRLLQRGSAKPAISGLLAAAASAALALLTGNPSDNFVLGLVINAVYGVAMLVSVLLRWPLVGVVVGFLVGDGVAWRSNRRRMRVLSLLTLMWAGLFGIRLAVELPLYFAGEAQVVSLGIAKLVLGTPLYALFVVVTWVVTRGIYPKSQSRAE